MEEYNNLHTALLRWDEGRYMDVTKNIWVKILRRKEKPYEVDYY